MLKQQIPSGMTKENGRAEALPFGFDTRSVENGTKYLLGGRFFLFAFHAHEFEFALFGDGCSDLLMGFPS